MCLLCSATHWQQTLHTSENSFWRLAGLPRVSVNMTHQSAGRLSTSPCIKNVPGTSVWKVGFQESVKESEIVLFSLLGVPQRTRLNNCNIYAEILGHSYAAPLLCAQSLWASRAQVNWLCEFPFGVLDSTGSFNLLYSFFFFF